MSAETFRENEQSPPRIRLNGRYQVCKRART